MGRAWNGMSRLQRSILDFCKMTPRDVEYISGRLRGQHKPDIIPKLIEGGFLEEVDGGLFKTTPKGKACLKLMPEQYKRWLRQHERYENARSRQ